MTHLLIFARCWRWWKQTSKEIKEDKAKKEQTEAENKAAGLKKKPESIEMQEQKPVQINTQEILWPTHSL